MKRCVFPALFLVLAGLLAGAVQIPPLSGRVNDTAGILTPGQRTILEEMLARVEDSTSSQVVLLTVPDLQGTTIEDFAIRVAESWKIGQKKLDNGVILVVAMAERRIRIEVGYGLEPLITDAKADYIIRRQVVPPFRDGNFYQGIHDGLESLAGIITREYDISPEELEKFRREQRRGSGKSPIPFGLIIFILFVLLNILGGRGGGRGGRGAGPFIFFGGGGGFSSGGGGFGGFSGGGGSFGGGGASGGW